MQPDADLETTLLGPLLPDRECGDCTACCTVLKVDSPDFKKPEGVPCRHLGATGCTIHAVRPAICRDWFCAWRRVAAMPEEARPDRSGILASLAFVRAPRNCLEGVAISVRTIAGDAPIASGMAAKVLDALCDRLVPVWFTDGRRKMLMHPEDAVARHVVDGTPPPADLRAEVEAWRSRYAAFADEAPPTRSP